MTAEATPGLGHNNPPQDNVSLLIRLQSEHVALAKRTDALLQAIAKAAPEILTDEQEAKASDFAAQLKAHIDASEDVRKKEKEPFLMGGRIIDAYFNNVRDPIVAGRATVMAKLTAYKNMKFERERIARETAERQAREAAEKALANAKTEADMAKAVELDTAAVVAAQAAAAPAAELTRSTGQFGGSSGLRTTPEYEIVGLDEVPRTYLMVNDAAIKAAIKASPKDAGGLPVLKIPGVRIYLKRTATGR